MTQRTLVSTTILLAGIALGGCESTSFFGGTSRVTFHNASESTVNVALYVEDRLPESPTHGEFVEVWNTQIARGENQDIKLTRSASWRHDNQSTVHVQVSPVAPTWEQSSAPEYWFEMLTLPPCSIVATGPASAMSFNSGYGQIAMVPNDEISQHSYRVVEVASDGAPDY